MQHNEIDTESLRILDHIEGYGDLIFEWDRRYGVTVYPEDESFTKEFTLTSRDHNALFDLIAEIDENPDLLKSEQE